MNLCDVNVLIYAHRADSTREHLEYKRWLKQLVQRGSPFGVSEAVLSGFIRLATNRRIFSQPSTITEAIEFCDNLLEHAQCHVLRPGSRNWTIFKNLCTETNVYGNLVPDAWHAALAIEYDCTLITTDSDYVRFKGLKWRHPLA